MAHPTLVTYSYLGEAIVVIIFTFEWAARLYVAPEDDTTRCTYIFSFYSLVDLCAILPWCQTNRNPKKPSEPDTTRQVYCAGQPGRVL